MSHLQIDLYNNITLCTMLMKPKYLQNLVIVVSFFFFVVVLIFYLIKFANFWNNTVILKPIVIAWLFDD